MHITISLDNRQVREALQLSGMADMQSLIEVAIKEFVARRRAPADIRELRGAGDLNPDYDYKSAR